MNSRLRDQW